MPKIKFTGWVEIEEMPDDRGSVDNWLVGGLENAVGLGAESETGLDALQLLHIRWELEK